MNFQIYQCNAAACIFFCQLLHPLLTPYFLHIMFLERLNNIFNESYVCMYLCMNVNDMNQHVCMQKKKKRVLRA